MLKNMVRKITALVTGGCGFIGSHIVDELVRRKYEVIVIDNLSTGHRANLNTKAKFYRRDVTKFSQIKKLFRGADFVFHAAALARIQPSIKDPRKTFDVNVLGTFNVLLSAKDAGVKKVIYSASSSVYGDQSGLPLKENMISHPKNMYALSKLFGEDMCKVFSRLYGLNTVSASYRRLRHCDRGIFEAVGFGKTSDHNRRRKNQARFYAYFRCSVRQSLGDALRQGLRRRDYKYRKREKLQH